MSDSRFVNDEHDVTIAELVVSDEARGSGIGTSLLEAARSDLLERGMDHWSIGVPADGPDAERLYRRIGFRPWNQSMLASTQDSMT